MLLVVRWLLCADLALQEYKISEELVVVQEPRMLNKTETAIAFKACQRTLVAVHKRRLVHTMCPRFPQGKSVGFGLRCVAPYACLRARFLSPYAVCVA